LLGIYALLAVEEHRRKESEGEAMYLGMTEN